MDPSQTRSRTRLDRTKAGDLVVYYTPKGAMAEEEMMRVSTHLDPKTDPAALPDGRPKQWKLKNPSAAAPYTLKVVGIKTDGKATTLEVEPMKFEFSEKFLRRSEPISSDGLDRETLELIKNVNFLNSMICKKFGFERAEKQLHKYLEVDGKSERGSESSKSSKSSKSSRSSKTSKLDKSEAAKKAKKSKKSKKLKKSESSTSSKSSKSSKSQKSKKSSNSESSKSSKASKPSKTPKTPSTRSQDTSPVMTAQGFDYLGRPLSHPLAVTPFPRACSIATREKAHRMLTEYGQKMRDKKTGKKKKAVSDSASAFQSNSKSRHKQTQTPTTTVSFSRGTKSSKSSSNSPRKPTRVSSDTRFPGCQSSETRAKTRQILKGMMADGTTLPKSRRKSKEAEEEEEKNSRKSTKSTTSLRTVYSKNFVRARVNCKKCTLCTDCAVDCAEKHTEKKVLSEVEMDKFREEIGRLREQFGKGCGNLKKTSSLSSSQFDPKPSEAPVQVQVPSDNV